MARSDRFSGGEIAIDDLAKDLARTLIELGEAYFAGSNRDVLGHGPHRQMIALGRLFVHTGRHVQGSGRYAFSRRHSCPTPPTNIKAAAAHDSSDSDAAGREPMRPSRRQTDELRAVSLERGVVKYAEGSCFVKFGDTHVLVTATLEDRLPPWLKRQARGWITAEYGMLPRATLERTRREASDRKSVV